MKQLSAYLLLGLLAIGCLWTIKQARSDSTPQATTSPSLNLNGTWLVDQSIFQPNMIMRSTLTLTDGSFKLHGYWKIDKDWTGSFSIGPGGDVRPFDLESDGFDFTETGMSTSYPKCTVPGILKLSGDRLTICFSTNTSGPRPTEFKASDHTRLVLLVKAETSWKGYPKVVKVTVLDPQGKPAADAEVFGYECRSRPTTRRADGGYRIETTQPAVLSTGGAKTSADGAVNIPFDEFADFNPPLAARDAARHLIGIANNSPAAVHNGTLTIQLQPERRIIGTIEVDGEMPAGQVAPWRAAYLSAYSDQFGFCEAPTGAFEFLVPPGTFTLYTYGDDLKGTTQQVIVPEAGGDLILPTVKLKQTAMLSLIGKPPPALVGVKAWKNGPAIDFGKYQGKVVLLDFWGYWCGSCVVEMPMLIRLHDKYADKGLAIVAVHVDQAGEIDTVEKLDQKTRLYRDGFWEGRDLPFPVALCSGKDAKTPAGNSERFGVLYYPTTFVIDRSGKILGAAREKLDLDLNQDEKTVDAAIEKLLAQPTGQTVR